ncbi:MAG: hypothetical protein Q8936_00715 [Bacillota bacterium]|nr:hypothetical protein [Bacillota bacterium]
MPAISKIRFTNVIYENGNKRYNDDIFQFDGHNGAILLENGGGKTVFIQTAIQAVLPHAEVADRKIKNTLLLENNAAHIAIEWIINESPRRYALTAVTLFMNKGGVDSYKYTYEYDENDDNSIEKLPFVRDSLGGNKRPATKEEMAEYYSNMDHNRMHAHSFSTIRDYSEYIENNFKIIPSEWRKIALINGSEGGVEAFFDACRTTGQLVDNLLIPVVEEALAGNGTGEFVETFEKQREHFKKYKQLKGRIDESKQVEQQINQYIDVYEAFHKASIKLTEEKEKAKAIYKFIEKEEENNNQKLLENETVREELEGEERLYNQKKESYKLALLKNETQQVEKLYEEVKGSYDGMKNSYDEKQKRYENLQIAKYKMDILEQQQRIKQLEQQIESLDQDEDIADIIERLHQNGCELRGYYVEEEDKLKKELSLTNGQINRYQQQLNNYETEHKKSAEEESKYKNDKVALESTIKLLNRDMEKIAAEILDNPHQEKVEEQAAKWQSRITELGQNIFNCEQQLIKLKEEKYNEQQALETNTLTLDQLKDEEHQLKEKLNSLNNTQTKLLSSFKELFNNVSNIDSIYLHEAKILTQMEFRVEKLKEDKENLIFKERLAYRFMDDYRESEFYTADPQIEKLIKHWRNSFSYIESGTQFLQRAARNIGKSEKELNELYPYWAVAVVVGDTELDKLMSKLEKAADELTQPVSVITEKEARSRIQGDFTAFERNVFPLSWESNLSQANFVNWRGEVSEKAKEATENRRKKEEEFTQYNELLKQLREFFINYPHELYRELLNNQKAVQEHIDDTQKEIHIKKLRIQQIDDEIRKNNINLSDFRAEESFLTGRISKARDYSSKKGEKIRNEADLLKVEENLEKHQHGIKEWDKRIKSLKNTIEEINRTLWEIDRSISDLKSEELYSEVLKEIPKYTSISKEVLKEQRKALKATLEKKQKGREVLQIQLDNAKTAENKALKELDIFLQKLEFSAEEDFQFPTYGEDEIKRLLEELKKTKKYLEKASSDLDKAREKFMEKQTRYQIEEENFYKFYNEIIEFGEALDQVKAVLALQEEAIRKRKDYNLKRREKLIKDKKNIEDQIQTMKIENGKFSYLAESIKEIELSPELIQEIPYKRKQFVSEIVKEIEKQSTDIQNQKAKVEQQQNLFIRFCENEIIDVRLKEMAVTGVQLKKNFEDIKQWQHKMQERISRSIEIAENDIREHDKEVQQFINHLHAYLVTMAQELKIIPKKTKIKVEDSWKEVFTFNVPEWDEKEGKEELAKHIDWMLMQLEEDKFRDDNGIEIEEQVKRAIEKWLQSKQLLQIVMKQNSIKVKCRKVTNNGKVSSTPFSWEQSNAWSGGEKWSKNMTLFLGILNYLAEKRKQIIPYSKRHRTVIVDNPFGKASSDHVLDPVFFVAQQLGFQIIALTAHAEGKFVRTYFPIVYSCRLREASNGVNQIVTMEREIRTAFFKDSDPQALIRLGELQQIGMFDFNNLK